MRTTALAFHRGEPRQEAAIARHLDKKGPLHD